MSYRPPSEPTIRPKVNFDPEATVVQLEKAFKGSGCDTAKVIELICGICNAQRQMLRTPYKNKYGRELMADLKKELKKELEQVVFGLMETPTKYDADQLHSAMKGLGTRESTLVDILCSRNNEELQLIKNEYKNEFGKSLEDDIVGDTSGDFQYLLVSLLQGKRDTSNIVNWEKARQDVKAMMGNAAKKEKPDKAVFNSVFATQNVHQLRKIFSEFQSMQGESIQSVVSRVFSGDAANAYVYLIDSIESKPRFFARQLYEAMKGMGTRDADLIRIVVARSEIDLASVRDEFGRMYKKPLDEWIKSECSGAYRDALIFLINGNY